MLPSALTISRRAAGASDGVIAKPAGMRHHGPHMANTSSALKRMRQNERRRLRNRTVRSKVRTAVKTARTALGTASADATAAVSEAIRALDKAVTKGVIHR